MNDLGLDIPLQDNPDYHVGLGDSVASSFVRSAIDTPIAQISRAGQQSVLEMMSDDVLQPADLNQRFNMAEIGAKPFNEPTKGGVAQFIYENAQRKHQLDQDIEAGPKGMFPAVARFVGGTAIPQFLDPINLATGGIGETYLAARGVLAGAGAAKAIGRSLVSNLAGNLVTEPIAALQNIREHQDYGVQDFATNLAIGTVASSGFELGLRQLGKAVSWGGQKVNSRFRGKEVEAAGFKQAMDQVRTGRKVNTEAVLHNANLELQPSMEAPRYVHVPSTREDVAAGKTFYGSTESNRFAINERPVDGPLGEGTYLSDHVVEVNNRAASAFNDEGGQLHEVSLERSNLADLDNIDEPHIRDDVQALMEETGETSPVEAIRAARSDENLGAVADKINQDLKDAGYDGYQYRPSESPQNSVFLFPEARDKMTVKSAKEPNAAWISPQAAEHRNQVLREQMAPASSDRFSPEADRKLSQQPQEIDLIKQVEQVNEVFDQAVEVGAVSKKVADQLKEEEEAASTLVEIGSSYINCLVRSG